MSFIQLPKNLPPLREELQIQAGGTDFSNTPTWLIYDPNDNKYYQIGYLEYQMLQHWSLGTPAALISALNKTTALKVTEIDLAEFINFLNYHCLTKQNYRAISTIAKISAPHGDEGIWKWLVEHYLFFRIPLVHPDAFLTKTLKYVDWLFKPNTIFVMLALGLIALFLVGREWEEYRTTFMNIFTFHGMILFMVTAPFCKIIHELGHAYMCKLQGLKVPMMGVAFLVMYPVFFTDTGHSWKLESKNQRLLISIAGIWMELYLAVIATWFWLFLPEGSLKSCAFFVSSASWIISLTLNISPFMRFDGYHVLGDLLGARNLQTRSFSYTRVWLRNLILGINAPYPEQLPKNKRIIFLVYALSTWIYRFVVYSGIAFLVYSIFFKALGIILFGVEVYFFLLGPIIKELINWYKLKSQITLNSHSLISSLVFIFLTLGFFTPWNSTISIPATYGLGTDHIFSPQSAQIDQVFVSDKQFVKKDQLLISMYSPELKLKEFTTQQKIIEIKMELRDIATNQKDLSVQRQLFEELKTMNDQLAQIKEAEDKLNIRATLSGKVTELVPSLRHGLWIMKDQLLMTLIDPNQLVIEGLVPYKYHNSIKKDLVGNFIPANLSLPAFKVKITAIDYNNPVDFSIGHGSDQQGYLTGAVYPDTPFYSLSPVGGSIAATADNQNNFEPLESQYRVEFSVNSKTVVPSVVERGTVLLTIQKPSLCMRTWQALISFLIKQSGF